MNTKKCGKCKTEKPINQFNKNKSRKDGLQNSCKICQAAYTKKHYNENKDSYISRAKIRNVEFKKWYKDIKKDLSCVKCGENHPAVIEFHHTNPSQKDFAIATAVQHGISRTKILEEIDKCIVVCSNCHRKIHYNERG